MWHTAVLTDLARSWPKQQEEVKDTALSDPVGAGSITFFADIHKHLSSIQPRSSTETEHQDCPPLPSTDKLTLATAMTHSSEVAPVRSQTAWQYLAHTEQNLR